MGLDSVELVVKMEDNFGIEISNVEAEQIYTVGDFYECILRKIKIKENRACQSQKLFYKIRKILHEDFNCTNEKIKPDLRLENIFPKYRRKEDWHKLQRKLNLNLPILHPPGLFFWINLFVFLGGGIAVYFMLSQHFIIVLLCAVLYYHTAKLSLAVTDHYRQELATDNLRNLIKSIIALN
ncbi:MAG: hypothetical protein AAFZ15_11470, partial [Bacteroidota bacterium]